MKLCQHICLNKILNEIEKGPFLIKKTRSLGKILEKPCVCSRGHIFGPILMKLGQNICLNDITDEFQNESCRVKSGPLGQILGKPCVLTRGHIFFSLILIRLGHKLMFA